MSSIFLFLYMVKLRKKKFYIVKSLFTHSDIILHMQNYKKKILYNTVTGLFTHSDI